jgi:hypothetical protein
VHLRRGFGFKGHEEIQQLPRFEAAPPRGTNSRPTNVRKAFITFFEKGGGKLVFDNAAECLVAHIGVIAGKATSEGIRLRGLRWTSDKNFRHGDLPGNLEVVGRNLCIDAAGTAGFWLPYPQRVSTARAVSMGQLKACQEAIEKRQKAKGEHEYELGQHQASA